MFQNDELKNHLETSFSVESATAVVAEWNMNNPDNIQKIGNYRYRKNSAQYSVLPNIFDAYDSGNFYTGATDADIGIQDGFEEDGTTPQIFIYPKDKEKMLYSLEDCLKPFRPRSGINKLSYFNNKYLSFPNVNMFLRPRYYMPTKDDEFKYWRSYRTETDSITNISSEYGVSKNSAAGIVGNHTIEDTNPFVVYKEPVPANRIVVKLQTNIGSIDLGPFRSPGGLTIDDPFFGESRKTVPSRFKVEYLNELDQWVAAYSFDETSLRDDNTSPIFNADGHLSLEYGIEIPSEYKNNFVLVDTIRSAVTLPVINTLGRAYLVVSTENSKGVLHIFNGEDYDTITPSYRWFIGSDELYENTHFVTDFTNPSYYVENENDNNTYREFVFLKGIRLVVETMNIPNTTLELIEISPRLVANLSNSIIAFDITKAAADLASSALPVGQIMAGTGSLSLFDNDQSFNPNNEWSFDSQSGSIIAKHIQKNIKFVFYDVIKNVNDSNYYVPIKTLYSEGFPERNAQTGETTLTLRDFYFYFESLKAPRILLTEVSLSQAICILLDSIGFSNYVFKRKTNSLDPVIPNFFIPPEQSIAETLAQLSRATQSAMFFDEYNNFVVMTKEYILDESTERSLDTTIYGSSVDGKLPNIIEISSQDKSVFNAGTINFTSRQIARTAGTIQQNKFVDRSYIYKPSLLWEAAGSSKTSSANAGDQTGYVLSALPLNTDLSDSVPTVSVNGELINNTFDVGENAYWIARFQGLLYSNGEIIKYDAVEYNVSGIGDVWISDNLEYQNYFSKIPFNGKIYPTGLVRIFADPYYETITGITITENDTLIDAPIKLKPGEVLSHGRGQFGTPVVSHKAGLDAYWTNNDNIQGCEMRSDLLFTTDFNPSLPTTELGEAGVAKTTAEKTQRNGIIRNFLSSKYSTETDVSSLKTTKAATIQSSALVMNGPSFAPASTPRDHISYVHKKLNKAYKHFGTRLRIIGKVEAAGNRSQSIVGGMTYLNIAGTDPTQTISVGGGSAGINLVNPLTNNGYYFEIAALTTSNIEELIEKNDNGEATTLVENILFYKIKKDANTGFLGGGTPIITQVGPGTSISYRIVGGVTPIAGTLNSPKTIPDPERTFGPGTVSSISQVGVTSVWNAIVTLTGEGKTTSALRIGDKITATAGTGTLFGGSPTSVEVTSINESTRAISYRVTGGTAPTVGNVTAIKTIVESEIIFGEVGVVQDITQPTPIVFGATGTVSSIESFDGGVFRATLSGLTSTSQLDVGDQIIATAGTGTLFGGTPTSVLIEKINSSTSINYLVTGGTTPTAGTVTNARTTVDYTTVWDARLTGLTSTSGLRVGDKISATAGTATKAVPVKLWGGIGNIVVDDGNFAGQYRLTGEENPTVYDLAIEYVDVNATRRDFYLYINQQLVGRVTDDDPLPIVNSSVGLFVRGNARAMFENIYALGKNYATNTVFDTNVPIAKVFGDSDNQINAIESLSKYALSSIVQNTYLSDISSTSTPGYDLYFEEFGTIMREAAYFNIKYERAFPALYAKIAPTFNRLKGYTVSGFTADSYGAEFLVFNNTDSALLLDSSTNNSLRILGIAFTGENTTSVTVDDFLKRRGNTSDPEIKGSVITESPFKFTEQYEKIRQSRILYGKNDFTLDSIYIQDLDTAENLLEWIIDKNIRPRKSIGLDIFSMPTLQLGDLVNVYYKDSEGIDLITPESVRYVVYNINYRRSVSGPEMTVYLSEV